MLQRAYFLAKIGADTAENEQHFAEILPKIGGVPNRCPAPKEAEAFLPHNTWSALVSLEEMTSRGGQYQSSCVPMLFSKCLNTKKRQKRKNDLTRRHPTFALRPPFVERGPVKNKLYRARSRLYRSQILQVNNIKQYILNHINYSLESSRRDLHSALLFSFYCTVLIESRL